MIMITMMIMQPIKGDTNNNNDNNDSNNKTDDYVAYLVGDERFCSNALYKSIIMLNYIY